MKKIYPDNLAVYLCECVFNKTKPIKYIVHDEDDWQFLCGDSHDTNKQPRIVGLGHIKEMLPNFYDIISLENGWQMECVNEEWKKKRFDDQDNFDEAAKSSGIQNLFSQLSSFFKKK